MEKYTLKAWILLLKNTFIDIWGLFHQYFTHNFYMCKSQKRKRTDSLTVLFAHLGSERVEALHTILVKLTPEKTSSFLVGYPYKI